MQPGMLPTEGEFVEWDGSHHSLPFHPGLQQKAAGSLSFTILKSPELKNFACGPPPMLPQGLPKKCCFL